jgi:hypothetical protein
MSKVEFAISHWHHALDGLQLSAEEFYKRVEVEVIARELNGVKIKRVFHPEGGLFSNSREYLRIKRKNVYYDICASPNGKGYFFSSWLVEPPSLILVVLSYIPILGHLLVWFLQRKVTFFRLDTAIMFNSVVHSCVTTVMDGLIDTQGLKKMTDYERKPIMNNIFKR